ncbi:MAG: T9SS type A sorting domain-containing protein [Bacteroidetes bacterium]|nr:T9SS type A sorting domain-containing protein [Bacteroidota bacterium]
MKKSNILILIVMAVAAFGMAQVPGAWYSRGIGGGGALFSPSINPANHNEIYMGCDMSELFHTTDMGLNWQEMNFLQIQGGHDACMQYTSNPQIRYCVDYSTIGGNDYIRPMKSSDGGSSWNVISGNPYPLTPNGNILRLLADYNNPGLVMIADYGTIYFSADGGASFHQVHTCLSNGSGNHIAGIFFDSPAIYIGTNDGLLVSTNNGQSFITMSSAGIPSNEYMLSFAGAKQGGITRFFCLTAANVWAGYQYGSDYWGAMKGIYQMDNAGGTWVSKTSGITTGSDFPVFVGMSADDISTAYLSGGSSAGAPIVMKSVNGGNWYHVFLTSNNQNIYTGWAGSGGDHAWSFPEAPFGFTVSFNDANTLMMSDYSCAHITTDGGVTWHQQYLSHADENPMNTPTPAGKKYHGVGLENTSCWQILWADSLYLFGAYSDINGIMSDNKGVSWKFIPNLTQNTVYRIVKHSSGKLYAASSNVHDMFQSTRIYDAQIDAGTGNVYVSTDNGSSFSVIHNFGHPVVWVALDPSNPEKMYASVLHHNKQSIGGIWMTSNLSAGVASSWSKMPAPPRSNGHPFNINVLNNGDLVCSFSARKPTNSSAFTDSSGVYYYNNASTTWYDRSDLNMRFWTQDVVVDPNDATESTWYAGVFQGWGTSGIQGTGGLFRTTDKGLSWTRINNNFRVNSCTVKPGHANEMYFTTETDGLWHSSNAAAGSPLFTQVSNYPFRHPMRVFFNPYDENETWVTSFGNGIKLGGDSSTGIGTFAGSGPVFSLYPNPCSEAVNLKISGSESSADNTYVISDITGRILLRGLFNRVAESRINTNALSSGIYILRVYSDGRPLGSSKLVKY